MIFVVPRFTSIFAELGSTLPLPTLILIRISEILTDPLAMGIFALVVFGAIFAFRRALRTPAGRLRWDRIQLRFPIVKNIITSNAYSQFARTLGALLANGVPVLQALTIVEDTVGNRVIAQEIRNARDKVTDGTTISGPLASGKVFPVLLTDMLAVGEESGDMSGALGHIAKRYESDLDRAVKVFTTVLEPILILFMAIMVGFVAISMLLAVFDLTSGLNV
jgi:type II secretory pathway component PulF